MIEQVLLYLISFSLFVVLQSLMINGINESCKGEKLVDGVTGKVSYQGMIFYELAPKFFDKYKSKWWSRPLWVCVKCMASFWGTVTFLPFVIYLFGFRWIELFVLCMDIFILVYLNYYFYKKA